MDASPFDLELPMTLGEAHILAAMLKDCLPRVAEPTARRHAQRLLNRLLKRLQMLEP